MITVLHRGGLEKEGSKLFCHWSYYFLFYEKLSMFLTLLLFSCVYLAWWFALYTLHIHGSTHLCPFSYQFYFSEKNIFWPCCCKRLLLDGSIRLNYTTPNLVHKWLQGRPRSYILRLKQLGKVYMVFFNKFRRFHFLLWLGLQVTETSSEL